MFAPATHATDPHDPGQQAEDAQLYRHVLHDLISIGTDLARLLHQDAIAHAMHQAQAIHPAPAATPGIAIAFDRTARAVRRCITLARSLAHPVPPPRPAQARSPARPHTLHAVEDTIQDAPGHGTPGDAPEDPHPEPRGRPVAEIIASICRDLGLQAPPGANSWERRTPEDTAQLRAHAAAPANPVPDRVTPGRAPPSTSSIPRRTIPPPRFARSPAQSTPAPPTPTASRRTTRPKPPPRSCATPPTPNGARRPMAEQPPRSPAHR